MNEEFDPTIEVGISGMGMSEEETAAAVANIQAADQQKAINNEIEEGKEYIYKISGISSKDLISNQLSGKTRINSDGVGEFNLEISADKSTEGSETFTVSIGNKSPGYSYNHPLGSFPNVATPTKFPTPSDNCVVGADDNTTALRNIASLNA